MGSMGPGRASGVGTRARWLSQWTRTLCHPRFFRTLTPLPVPGRGGRTWDELLEEAWPLDFLFLPSLLCLRLFSSYKTPVVVAASDLQPVPLPTPHAGSVPASRSGKMAVIMRFFVWIRRVWHKVTCWVLQWRHRSKPTILEPAGSKKQALKATVEKTPMEIEPVKLIESPKEAKVPALEECPEVAETYVLANTVDETEMELDHESRSLLRLPQTAVQSVSTLMLSALQSGWQMCRWKSSVSSTSMTSQLRRQSPLETPEAEMLREVYLVLWAIRKQLRQLARRQERRRRRHIRTHCSSQLDTVQGLKQDARSPL